jgi:hypothetical protein
VPSAAGAAASVCSAAGAGCAAGGVVVHALNTMLSNTTRLNKMAIRLWDIVVPFVNFPQETA